ncbi:MAG: 50S ribosomal protein L15 [Armatimonadetes bacterium]|nr:50S ribosomal protein L15 [Armatimonadota bacterium]MDW8121178.1 50S ribosomal protein L15 [Armatimonadota bacterium]
MRLDELKPAPGSKKRRKRVGRGIAAGQGKTAGRGTKGQKAREQVAPWFEGGQSPLYKRVPKRRGETKIAMPVEPFRKRFAEVTIAQLARLFAEGTKVDPQDLRERGIIRRQDEVVRVVGTGELDKPLLVFAHHFTKGAKEKIEKAGGKAVVIGR